MRSFAVLALLAGCGFHTHGTTATGDAPSGGGDDAPPQIDGAIDAPNVPPIDAPPDSPPADTDGDGVPDATDNCPMVANADQRDHDADGRGDVCDLCPHIPEAADTDTDSDGVGDACDPHPTTAGDTRLLWVGFYDANDITGWPKQGTWSVANGHLTGGANNTALSYIYEPTSYPHAYAETLAHFNSLATATMTVAPAAHLYTGDAGQAQYYQCAIAGTNNGNQVTALDVYPINQNHFDQTAWSGTLAVGSEIMLHAGVLGGMHTCTATQGATTATAMQQAGAMNGVVVLGTASASVSFDYLFVVGMP